MRMKFAALAALTVLAALGLGCGPEPSKSSESAAPGKPVAVQHPVGEAVPHLDANVRPGSYEDWCVEHEVPETLCTRCNPELAAAFKATGDWCQAHGVPESQCRQCNPSLKITRPPKPEGS